jgi:biopolymer transport protein ExbB
MPAFINFFQQGGVMMWGLAALSVLFLALVLIKIQQWHKQGLWRNSFLLEIDQALAARDIDGALRQCADDDSASARILHSAFLAKMNSKQDREQKKQWLEAETDSTIRVMGCYLTSIQLIAQVAPLLGLLGTVIGMIEAFAAIQQQAGNAVDPTLLAGGIWQALVTTVAGLVIAIPALAAHSWLENTYENWLANIRALVLKILL